MNIKQIRELAQIVRENNLSALEISENESRIRIECARGEVVVAAPAVAPMVAPAQAAEAPLLVVKRDAQHVAARAQAVGPAQGLAVLRGGILLRSRGRMREREIEQVIQRGK